MKKKLFSIALAIACLAGPVAVSAQTPASTPRDQGAESLLQGRQETGPPQPLRGAQSLGETAVRAQGSCREPQG